MRSEKFNTDSPVDAAGLPLAWLGVALGAVVIVFRVERIAVAGIRPSVGEWALLLAPEVGLVLGLGGLFALLNRGATRRVAGVLALPVFVMVALFIAAQHCFFLKAGYRLSPDLASYAARNLGMLGGLLSSTVDRGLLARLLLAVAAPVAAWTLARRRPHSSGSVAKGVALLAVGVLLLTVPSRGRGAVASLAENDLVAFGRSLVADPATRLDLDPHLVAPDDYYRAPRVVADVGGEELARRPNLLLVVLESTGAAMTPPIASAEAFPALAEFARTGTVVTETYATVTHTSKALVAMLCGVAPRLESDILEAEKGGLPLPCLPRLLEQAGYRTAFLQTATGEWENRTGLVENLGFESGAYQETLARPGFESVGFLGIDEFAMLVPALSWMAAPDERPFFATLLTVTPHFPYNGPGRSERTALERPHDEYLESLRHQDRFLAALFDGMRTQGLNRDTAVVLIGDHGEAFGEHVRKEHDAVPYEEVVRVPWMMRGPDGPLDGRSSVDGLRSHLDLLPTLLGVAEVEWEGRLPGRDVRSSRGHEQLFTWCWGSRVCGSVRAGRTKLVSHFGRRPAELYDLATDPGEVSDRVREDVARARDLEARFLGRSLSVGTFWAGFGTPETAQ